MALSSNVPILWKHLSRDALSRINRLDYRQAMMLPIREPPSLRAWPSRSLICVKNRRGFASLATPRSGRASHNPLALPRPILYKPRFPDIAAGACGKETIMAVPKRKTSPSRRGMRRSADALKRPTYIEDKDSGELRRPHHIDLKTGMYKGRQVLKPKTEA